MTKRQRRQQARERRQVCLANRRAGTRSVKPLSLGQWVTSRQTGDESSLPRHLARSACCWPHLRTLKRLQRHLISKHGMSADYTGWLDFEAEYMRAVLA